MAAKHPAATLRAEAEAAGLAVDSLDFARRCDVADPLAEHRAAFHFPHTPQSSAAGSKAGLPPCRYFVGNSLGLQHRGVEPALQRELAKWRDDGVEGHFRQPGPWFEADDALRPAMAKVVGAKESEVVVMNTLTVNLHILLAAFYAPHRDVKLPGGALPDGTPRRTKILCEKHPFPSDVHAFVSQVRCQGFDPDTDMVEIGMPEGKPAIVATETFLEAIEKHKDTAAVIVIGAVHFLTGQFFDIKAITDAAHAAGIKVGVDAAHAVGNVPLHFHDWGVDFACWCTYKYLNGGPGNIGGAFVHEKHTGSAAKIEALHGWWGAQRDGRMALGRQWRPSEGAAAFQMSNPCIMAMRSLAPSLTLAAEIGMPALRAKSLRLTAFLELLLDAHLGHALQVVTPRDVASRGAQLSVRILPGSLRSAEATAGYKCGTNVGNESETLQQQLLSEGIMCDNRPPDMIRLAPVPTYNSFEDVFVLVAALRKLMVAPPQ